MRKIKRVLCALLVCCMIVNFLPMTIVAHAEGENTGSTQANTQSSNAPEITLSNDKDSGKIVISWEKVDEATKYEVYRSTSKSGTYKKLTTTTKTSVTNTSAEAGKTYYYKVRAICSVSAGNSAYSEIKSASSGLPGTTLTVTMDRNDKPLLTWEPLSDAIEYEVWYSDLLDGEYVKLLTIASSENTINHSGAAVGSYFYKVRALTEECYTQFSNVGSVFITPGTPTLTVKENSNGYPRLTWTEVPGATAYEIWHSTSRTGTYTLLATRVDTAFTHSNADLTQTNYYKVRAVAGEANGEFSAVKYISNSVIFEGDYTYDDWVSTLSSNWNIHDYETSDQSYPIEYLTSGLYSFIFNDALNPVAGRDPYDGYVIMPEMAASLPVDVTARVKAEGRFDIPDGATSGYAYTIDLNPNATFEDGTPITADDYVESMKRLLDPKLRNYRASNYFEGSFCIVGAQDYYNAGRTVTIDNGVAGTIAAISDLTKNKSGVYCLSDGTPVYLAIDYGINWCGGNSLADYVNAYGDAYFAMDTWEALYAMVDENGLVPLTDEALALFIPLITGNPNWGETDADAVNYLVYDQTYPEVDFSTVGLYKSGEYQITIVLTKHLAGFNLLYNLTGNWLVKCDLYDACLREDVTASGSVWTSTYCTSIETTCSYGPYKLSSYQTDKGMHFVRNENWYGYADGKHVYVDPVDGLTYPMYMTSEINCLVVSEVATAKLMFLKGELMQYGLQVEDFDTYRNSDYCHFTPGQATFFLLLNGNMPAIKEREAAEDFDQSKYDLEVLTLTSFHRAMGLTYDKDLYCENRSPADSGAFGLIGHAYIADPETGAKYRDSEAAKLVLCEVYGVDVSKYASLDDAVDSITGYDPVAAKEWYVKAYNEALELGYITDANNDGICDQTIQLTYSASSVSDKLSQNLEYLSQKANEVTAGTPFEGKISFVASAPLGNEWSNKIKSGECDTCLGGWTGSAMDPFGLIEVYTNPNYQYDAAWFDATTVDMTLTINGEEITMNLFDWTLALNGTEVNGYNFGDGMVSNDIRVEILAGIEKAILLQYNYLPFIEDGSMHLLTQKAYYVVDKYNPVMGRGGIAYLRYAYNDAEWAAYVAECGGELTY